MSDPTNSGKSVLVVDDQDEIKMLITHLLEKAGYQTDTAANGLEALDKLRAGSRPDLILLDIIMPVMDGYEFLDALQHEEDLNVAPIVMLTSMEHADDVLKALKLGASDYCTKPFNPDDLMATIARVMASSG